MDIGLKAIPKGPTVTTHRRCLNPRPTDQQPKKNHLHDLHVPAPDTIIKDIATRWEDCHGLGEPSKHETSIGQQRLD